VLTSKRVEGEVEYNNLEVRRSPDRRKESRRTFCSRPIQMHRCDTKNTPEEFQHRFAGGRLA
jgi:hypothetical protein